MIPPGVRSGRSLAPTKPLRVDPDHETWRQLLAHMREKRPDICRHWFEEMEPLGIMGGVLYLRTHTTVHRDYLNRDCSGPFNEAAQFATGRLISVRFLGPEENIPAEHAPRNQSGGLSAADGAAGCWRGSASCCRVSRSSGCSRA
ncbi:hypothetical protein BH11PLA1_BH11PLA1_24130 [soil metagenome]